ncbi:MAG: phosphoribosylformylglycinamidine synthase subunit PurL [Candidatus Niyogibacteria bacterium]|nr:phosphoribosylformylglycinamidine synthase subunit PurL [Candidatus Niyogibacteria bacterium]
MLGNDKDALARRLAEAMASEHTSYKSTKKFLSRLPTAGPAVIQGPGENAGILDLGRGWALALRIESHNHPTFIRPYQGAATGVGGILRDIFTMGARPIGLLDFLRFGTDANSERLFREAVRGIADYGNCVGVPVVGGDIFFDKTYNNNCLVNVAAFGLIKKSNIIYGNALTVGSDLIYVGARTGRDGIGGAEMASANLERLDESTTQDPDPFLEKLLLEACWELANTKWIEGMQDMGAAGLLCSTSEVVLRGRKKTGLNLGARVYLNRVPVKAANLTPAEFLLSESQERMLIVGKRECRDAILRQFKKWDLEAHVIGAVTDDGNYTVVHDEGRRKNIEAPMDFEEIFPDVHEKHELKPWQAQKSIHQNPPAKLKQEIWHQYDWMVGVRTLKGPDQKGSYAIFDIPEIDGELIVSWSSDEGRADKDPAQGIEYAFDRCYSTIKKLGAKPLGLTNCLNFGHPRDSMGVFAQTIDALSARCREKRVPIVGGNVSLYNASGAHSIKPTPILVMAGIRKK